MAASPKGFGARWIWTIVPSCALPKEEEALTHVPGCSLLVAGARSSASCCVFFVTVQNYCETALVKDYFLGRLCAVDYRSGGV